MGCNCHASASPECLTCRPLTNARSTVCAQIKHNVCGSSWSCTWPLGRSRTRPEDAELPHPSACRSAAPPQLQVPAGGATGTAAPPQPRHRNRATSAAPLCILCAAVPQPCVCRWQCKYAAMGRKYGSKYELWVRKYTVFARKYAVRSMYLRANTHERNR